MDLRYAPRFDGGAGLLQVARELLESRCHVAEALLQRCEVARDQVVDRAADTVDVIQRIPGPLLERIDSEQPRFDLRPQQLVVDLVRARQRIAVDPGERVAIYEIGVAESGPRVGVDLVEFAIRAVVADPGGRNRRKCRQVTDELCRQVLEISVGCECPGGEE